MKRREALRLLATGTALQLAPHRLFAVLREARKLVETQTAPRTLNAHQNATVKVLADLLIPKTDTPGASDVGVSEFVDLMLTEWYDEPDRSRFLNGLGEVDLRTQALFGTNFIEASPDRQGEILTWLGQKMTAEVPPVLRPRSATPHAGSKNFYSMFRQLTLTAYYTSEAGATNALHYEIIPESHSGCVEVPTAKGGAQNQ